MMEACRALPARTQPEAGASLAHISKCCIHSRAEVLQIQATADASGVRQAKLATLNLGQADPSCHCSIKR